MNFLKSILVHIIILATIFVGAYSCNSKNEIPNDFKTYSEANFKEAPFTKPKRLSREPEGINKVEVKFVPFNKFKVKNGEMYCMAFKDYNYKFNRPLVQNKLLMYIPEKEIMAITFITFAVNNVSTKKVNKGSKAYKVLLKMLKSKISGNKSYKMLYEDFRNSLSDLKGSSASAVLDLADEIK